jgi:hypothetical protein
MSNVRLQLPSSGIGMSQQRETVSDKALLLPMATMWLNLAEFAGKTKAQTIHYQWYEDQG